jgi:hypothetical protein
MAVVRQANLFRNGVLLEALITASKEIGLEANVDKIKYLVMSRDQLWRDILSLKIVITLKSNVCCK